MASDPQFIAEVGTLSAGCVIVPLGTATAQSLLPRELRLGQQSLTAPGTHPLICLFGSQDNVQTVLPFFDGADPEQVLEFCHRLGRRHKILAALPLTMDYLEVVTLLPGVEWTDPNNTCQGPFVFAPRLYLDDLLPTLLGWLCGLAKDVAQIAGDPSSFRVNRLLDNALLFTGSLEPTGQPGPPSAFPNFAQIQPLFGYPNIGRTQAGSFVCIDVKFEWSDAQTQMQAGPAQVKLTTNFFEQQLAEINFAVHGIDQVPVGAFLVKVPWKLTSPRLCGPA
jgi:hypothetical protein